MPKESKGFRVKTGFASLFDLPRDILLNLPRITVIGNLQIILENHRGLVEYSDERIRINLEGKELTVTGSGLTIGAVSEAEIMIEGNIEGLHFR